MTDDQTIHLIQLGGSLKVRAYLKRLAIKDRMKTLHRLIPHIQADSPTLAFFRQNFSKEIGALVVANFDYVAAETIYNEAKILEKPKLLRSRTNPGFR